jgi:transposase-like protein
VLVELRLVEQRYRAVLEVLNDGATVTDGARRYGVVRQTMHVWLREHAAHGRAGLVDGSSRPATCPIRCPRRSRRIRNASVGRLGLLFMLPAVNTKP